MLLPRFPLNQSSNGGLATQGCAMLQWLKMKSATAMAHELAKRDMLEMDIDGEIQVDAALNPEIARVKGLASSVAGKANVLIINTEIHTALQYYLNGKRNTIPREYLFKSRKGWNYPLTTYAVTHYVQNWCDEINLVGNYGAHTLRKTWAYQQRKQFGVPWEVIAKRLNHSNPAVTRRYMGVQAEEVEEALLNAI